MREILNTSCQQPTSTCANDGLGSPGEPCQLSVTYLSREILHDALNSLFIIIEFSSLLKDDMLSTLNARDEVMLMTIQQRGELERVRLSLLRSAIELLEEAPQSHRNQCSVGEVLELCQHGLCQIVAAKKAVLQITVGDDLQKMTCDPQRMSNCLTALVLHASRFLKSGQKISLDVQYDAECCSNDFRLACEVCSFEQTGYESGRGDSSHLPRMLQVARLFAEANGAHISLDAMHGGLLASCKVSVAANDTEIL